AAAAQPTPGAPTTAATPVTPKVTYRSAPAFWHLLDPETDGVAGVGARRAVSELLNNAAPKRMITVAVIDGGVDTSHTALRDVLVLNARETPANGRDDDGNGYVDDARGWNFIGGATGNIDGAQLELTRLVAQCRANGGKSPVSAPCTQLESEYTTQRDELAGQWAGIKPVLAQYDSMLAVVAKDNGVKATDITDGTLGTMQPKTPASRTALQRLQAFALNGLTPNVSRAARRDMEGRLNVGFNLAFDGRQVVGDTPAMGRRYGNANVTGPDASHGTAVASVIGAARGDSGFVGIAAGIRILPVRVVPNGDEADKDVANGIRYAVEAGAQIINMSFGKPYSPGKAAVDSAVQFAVSRGVLLVHASGNESVDVDATPTFPSATYAGSAGRAATWIDVGASSWKVGDQLAADFSNFGRTSVDIFAPGVSLFAAALNDGFGRDDGTSVAAPVVSGVAALLMSQFPTLTAADVKRILLATATQFPNLQVSKPGSRGQKVSFASLSASGGIVNAYEAVKMAQRETAKAQ
ncbi:MAG: S8 family serine peptidase, partial [Gemmatimonadaceae bacterium]|nr:S8 family serine peptidase [Gemmatimonadaceae bacterium]